MESFRFKVVKIISKEPFKRGRWLCMDFTDPPSNGTTNIEDCLAHNRPDMTSSVGQGVGSAVAIDNKIEQAMDLVKSHLMFAVREEMDVLKEKIFELNEKYNRSEMENKIFRAHATPETLQLIEQYHQQAQAQPRQNNSPSQLNSLPSNQQSQQQQQTNTQLTTTSPQTTQQQTTTQLTQQNNASNSTINTVNTINTINTISTAQSLNQPQQQQLNQQNQQNQQNQPLQSNQTTAN